MWYSLAAVLVLACFYSGMEREPNSPVPLMNNATYEYPIIENIFADAVTAFQNASTEDFFDTGFIDEIGEVRTTLRKEHLASRALAVDILQPLVRNFRSATIKSQIIGHVLTHDARNLARTINDARNDISRFISVADNTSIAFENLHLVTTIITMRENTTLRMIDKQWKLPSWNPLRSGVQKPMSRKELVSRVQTLTAFTFQIVGICERHEIHVQKHFKLFHDLTEIQERLTMDRYYIEGGAETLRTDLLAFLLHWTEDDANAIGDLEKWLTKSNDTQCLSG